MKYDFTSIIDRLGQDALAVDKPAAGCFGETLEGFDQIPMWVADMNFPCLPKIQEEIIRRVQHPTFGYFDPRKEYFDAIISWQEKRNGVTGLRPEWIGYENGVLGGVVSAVSVFSKPGDPVLLQSPTYVGFTSCLEQSGYRIVLSDLKKDEEGVWRMDLQDMEEKIREQHIHTAVFCSPHNPAGRVWERKELEEMMDLFRRYDVYVVSDEIWSDLILRGKHIPLWSLSEDAKNRTAAFYSCSKTFNLAGLVGSYHIIPNDYLRDRILSASGKSHYNNMNVLSMYGAIAGFSEEGGEWVDELCEVIRSSADFACDYIRDHFPGVSVARPEGTYMLYLDCEGYCTRHGLTLPELLDRGIRHGVIWQDGRPFHRPYGIRINLASPKSRIEEAFRRLSEYVFTE